MPDINAHDFLNELRFDIETKDMIKARLVLAHFEDVDPKTQKMALFELSKAPYEFTIPQLVGLLAENPTVGEANPALKEILFSKALDKPELLSRMLLRESKPAHRMVLAEISGELRMESVTPILLSLLSETNEEKVLRSAIHALGLIGDASATTPISEFLYSGSVELIIAAIQSLGQLATPTAPSFSARR